VALGVVAGGACRGVQQDPPTACGKPAPNQTETLPRSQPRLWVNRIVAVIAFGLFRAVVFVLWALAGVSWGMRERPVNDWKYLQEAVEARRALSSPTTASARSGWPEWTGSSG